MIDNFLKAMYQKYLGRDPEEEGFNFWKEKLESGELNQEEVEKAISESPEAVARSNAALDSFILKFEFSVAQTNALLNILGNAPYVQSAALVKIIQAQGEPQFKAALEAEGNKEK